MTRWLLALTWTLAACGTPELIPTTQTPEDCVDGSICNAGQACLNGVCTDVGCTSATSCGLGSFCDLLTYSCLPGCQGKQDCAAHQACDNGTCVDLECRETPIDCDVGETCDSATGTCSLVNGLCASCSDNDQCGDGRCARFRADEDLHCYDHCDSDADCAAGFDCLEFDFRVSGRTVTESICYASCPWLLEEGWL